eukprot:gene24817-53303_t
MGGTYGSWGTQAQFKKRFGDEWEREWELAPDPLSPGYHGGGDNYPSAHTDDGQLIRSTFDAYTSYWDDIRFRKGARRGELTVRMAGGNAVAWLRGAPPDAAAQPRRFVRDVVHHTFRDAAGYIDGLDQ